MREITGDLFVFNPIVIPVNGTLDRKGHAVMGAGVAFQSKKHFPELPRMLGWRAKHYGSQVFQFAFGNRTVFTFPTKNEWWDSTSSLNLIEKSAKELASIETDAQFIYLPRVGCGCGKLDWEQEVKPILESILDDRFIVVHPQEVHERR